mmetsp:Transcript_35024/g.83056  ORF Transcript_35024/g.83056 Transcript_35024/m.83056 type:complete len:231 (+) Transcript_35024:1203-1895(+)
MVSCCCLEMDRSRRGGQPCDPTPRGSLLSSELLVYASSSVPSCVPISPALSTVGPLASLVSSDCTSIRAFDPERPLRPLCLALVLSTSSSSSSTNVLPFPSADTQCTWPFISSARLRQMLSPRPEPPYFPTLCFPIAYLSKRLAWVSWLIPLPVSITFQKSRLRSGVAPSSASTVIVMPPFDVNLTLFQQKLARICWILPSSPRKCMSASSGGSTSLFSHSPFSSAARPI